jgi:hypothetical protein
VPSRSLLLVAVAATALAAAPTPSSAAARPLHVAVSRLEIRGGPAAGLGPQQALVRGHPVPLTVRYVVRGAPRASARAFVTLTLRRDVWRYRLQARPRRVFPGIWEWATTGRVPATFPPGVYRLTATVTLRGAVGLPSSGEKWVSVRVA